MPERPRIGAGLSGSRTTWGAAREAAAAAAASLDGARADLALVFLSSSHREGAAEAADAVRDVLDPGVLAGCVAQGVLGGREELEEGPGVAVWAARLPGATVEAVALRGADARRGADALPQPDDAALAIVLADPFAFPVHTLLASLDATAPGLPVVGGVAVGGRRPGEQALILDGELHDEGALAIVLGGVPVRTVVSQGCAPIGRDAVITSAEGNLVYELAGRPAYERLREELASLPPDVQGLAAGGLLAGIVIDENKPDWGAGDYLMRGLLGADESTGALAIGDDVRVGQTLRFHVRDAETAGRDLDERLAAALAGTAPAGALLFTCNGRGTSLFPAPGHDAGAVVAALRSDAVAGFFCGGEIGPVGGRTFLHGFTATLAVFLES